MKADSTISSARASQPLAAKIIGLGGAGLQMIHAMAQTDLGELPIVAVHSDSRVLANSSAPAKLLLGAPLLRGLGAGGDPDLGKAAAEQEISNLRTACADANLIFLVAGLGGGTATGAAPVLARVARETGALVLAVITLPFELEGARRLQQARLGLQQLKAAADGVLCLPHQRMAKLLDNRTSALEALNLTNVLLAQGIRGIWQMLTRFGLLQVDFADLCSALRGRHVESAFATAQAEGEDRIRAVTDRLLANPLLDEGKLVSEAETLLVHLVGGPDLTMGDVNRVMERMKPQAEQARIFVGAAIDDRYRGRLDLTVILSRRGQPVKDSLAGRTGSSSGVACSPDAALPEIESQFFGEPPSARPSSRFIPPPPDLSSEQTMRLLAQRAGSSGRRRKSASNGSQGQLPLEIISKGRFEKSEPTLHHGEDLDVPTYIRRGVALN